MVKRKMMSRSRETFRTRIPSHKNGTVIFTESLGERDYARFLEVNPLVKRFESQGARIEYELDGKHRTYTADFVIERLDWGTKVLREIKNESEWKTEKDVRKYLAIRKRAHSLGYHFAVISKKWIKSEPRYGNVKNLYRYRLNSLYEEVESNAIDLLKAEGQMTIEDFELQAMLKRKETLSLIAQGIIGADVNMFIASKSTVWSF